MKILRRHLRFLVALGIGLAVWFGTGATTIDPVLRVIVTANAYFVVYLALMVRLTAVTTPEDLRRHAETDDEGWPLILLLAVAAVAVSLTAIFLVLNREESASLFVALFALLAAPLGWTLMQMLLAYRYAHLFFSGKADPGMEFPPAPYPLPGVWDFLYASFTIGMTAQVSDVSVTNEHMRKVVLLHAIGSYFYNTVILALAVNAGINLSS